MPVVVWASIFPSATSLSLIVRNLRNDLVSWMELSDARFDIDGLSYCSVDCSARTAPEMRAALTWFAVDFGGCAAVAASRCARHLSRAAWLMRRLLPM